MPHMCDMDGLARRCDSGAMRRDNDQPRALWPTRLRSRMAVVCHVGRDKVSARSCVGVLIAAVVLFAGACGSGGGERSPGTSSSTLRAVSSPGQSSASASAAQATPTARPQQAAIPADCMDKRLTASLAGLIDGKQLNSTNAGTDQLSCLWGKAVPIVNVGIAAPSTPSNDADFQVVDVPELRKIGATARARTTQFSLGAKALYISTFVVSSDQFRITVSYSGEDRRDQEVADATVAIAERLHG